MSTATAKAYKGVAMEGWIAKWYAANTMKDIPEFQALARRVTADLPSGSAILEVAPGPGYLAVELAKSGTFRVEGLDISQSFVKIARTNAARQGVDVEFRHGNAASMPFDSGIFDRVVCRAAFKNFTEPVRVLTEMHRVLRPGGKAVIADLRRDAPKELIDAHVNGMHLGAINSLFTRWIFRGLVKSACSMQQLREMVSKSGFRKCDIGAQGIGFEVWLEK
jgi:ubiquinone/menaquinone biosynthesis C-methylase UbiE